MTYSHGMDPARGGKSSLPYSCTVRLLAPASGQGTRTSLATCKQRPTTPGKAVAAVRARCCPCRLTAPLKMLPVFTTELDDAVARTTR